MERVLNNSIMRLDRRKAFPIPSADKQAEVIKAMIPERVNGIIKSRGLANVNMRRAVGRVGYPYTWMFSARRMNFGGTSKQFGSQYVSGITLDDNQRVILKYNFDIELLFTLQTINGAQSFVKGIGHNVEASVSGIPFGIVFQINNLPKNVKIVASVTKVNGTFETWGSSSPSGNLEVIPRKAKVGIRTSVITIEPVEGVDGNYGILGDTNVTGGDNLIIHWIAIIQKRSDYSKIANNKIRF